jgi:hypothetical protein
MDKYKLFQNLLPRNFIKIEHQNFYPNTKFKVPYDDEDPFSDPDSW